MNILKQFWVIFIYLVSEVSCVDGESKWNFISDSIIKGFCVIVCSNICNCRQIYSWAESIFVCDIINCVNTEM